MVMHKCRCGARIDGGKENELEGLFFRVMLGDFRSRLYIPPIFAERIRLQKKATAIISLSSSSGLTWQAILHKTHESMFMEEWKEFVDYHSIKDGDLLLFKYSGNLKFYVRLFDMTACERVFNDGVPTVPRGSEACVPEDTEGNSDRSSSEEDSTSNDSPRKRKAQDAHPRTLDAGYISKRRPATNEEISSSYQLAFSFIKGRPDGIRERCFMVGMTETSVYKGFHLSIPKNFADKFGLWCVGNIILHSSYTSKEYRAKLDVTAEGGCGLVDGGWRVFCRDNKLEEGDVCVFEGIDLGASDEPKGRRECAFIVYFFRAGGNQPPSVSKMKSQYKM